jgi:hypothetical protein
MEAITIRSADGAVPEDESEALAKVVSRDVV